MSAEFVLEMAWKSTVLAVTVLSLLTIMRRQDPSHRAAVGGLGLAILPLLPLIVLAVAVLPVPSIELPAPTAAPSILPVTMDHGGAFFPLAVSEPQALTAPTVPVETLIAAIWATGALLVLLRLASGLFTLRRWTKSAARLSSPSWDALLRKCNAPDRALLMVSDRVSAPLSWGWRTPVILLNRDTLADPRDAEAIIAHEAAHLSRLDWPRLLAARLAVALFWFNPLVWLLERRHVQDVEEAADAVAAAHIEPTRYAQTLLNVARDRSAPVGANSMAQGTLSKRIIRVLNPRVASPRARIWRSGALAGVAMIAGSVAITQFVSPAVSAAVASTPAAAPVAARPVASAVAAPTPTAKASTPIGAKEVAAAVAMAQAPAADPTTPYFDRKALDEALRSSEEARTHALAVARNADKIAADARTQVAASMANMRGDMLRGADEMERGAVEMRKGAATMREEARKLRDPAYRAEQIRKAVARGDDHVPTDQDLIDAIPKMEEGARKMDAGVEKMRKGAQKMREQANRS